MEIAVTTVKQNKDSAVKQRIQDIQMLISCERLHIHISASQHHGFITNSMASMEMVEWEVSPKKRRLCSVKHYARFQTAYVLLQTEYKMRLGLIIPHKTNILIL